MALQEFIDQSWNADSGNYFENKRQYQQAVNDEVARQRNINTAKKAIARNLKKGLRAKIGTAENAATGSLVKMAKDLGIADPLAGAGLNQEVGDAREKAAFTLNENFLRAKRQEEELRKRTGNAPAAGQQNAGAQPVIGANSVLRPETVANAQQGQQKSVLTKPDWAKDVENDRTFPKGFFDDKANLARIQGMSRAEVADMLNKARVARFMNGITSEAAKARAEEVNALKASQDVANKNQLTPDLRSRLDAIYANPDVFNQQQIDERNKLMNFVSDNKSFADQSEMNVNNFANIVKGAQQSANQSLNQAIASSTERQNRFNNEQKAIDANFSKQIDIIDAARASDSESFKKKMDDMNRKQAAEDRASVRDLQFKKNKVNDSSYLGAAIQGSKEVIGNAFQTGATILSTTFPDNSSKISKASPVSQSQQDFINKYTQPTRAEQMINNFKRKIIKQYTY